MSLGKEVVHAVRDGRFRVYAVTTAIEALELQIGLCAGERNANVTRPDCSVNFLVYKRLKEMLKKPKVDDRLRK